ncbi:MAG: hypothetical protein KKA79_01205, partial [Nanoarchaeota archaeon]|nr:hypothetical protein [Nanoarchaeota archaeon]
IGVIKHDVANFTGYHMKGGKIIVKGNAGKWTAIGMRDGKMVIKGDVTGELGTQMIAGEIYVSGKVKKLYRDCRYATIYEQGVRKIWPKDEDS